MEYSYQSLSFFFILDNLRKARGTILMSRYLQVDAQKQYSFTSNIEFVGILTWFLLSAGSD